MTRLPGPTATGDKQWANENITANLLIPVNRTAGVNSDFTSSTAAGACSSLFELKISVNITHPRPADLFISAEALTADGKGALASAVLFDGKIAGQTNSTQALLKMLSGDFSVNQLLNAAQYCGRWRLNADLGTGQPGMLNGWTLKFRTAWYPFTHDMNYFSRLLFGDHSAPDPYHKPVVNDYYLEVSRNHFGFIPAGMFGPVDWPTWRNATDAMHRADVIHLLEARGFNFAAYDHNGNGQIDNDELEILAIDNSSDDGGMNRNAGGCVPLNQSRVQVCASVAFVGEQIDFQTLAHEMSHSLGTRDLYGVWNQECFSFGFTLMSCTENGPDLLSSVYLDPWHRKRLGWVFPYAASFGPYELGDETWMDFYGNKSRPAVFYRDSNPKEYYLFEYRGGRSYDNRAPNWGIVAWHVLETDSGDPGDPVEGHAIYVFSPVYKKDDQAVGGSRPWTPADGRFQVAFKDGSYLPLSFWVEQPAHSNNSMILHWDAAPANNAPPTIQIIQPADNSSGPVGYSPTIPLQAIVKDARGGTDGLRVLWVSDVDGNLASGMNSAASFLTPGPRVITVIATDQYGATSRKSVKFTAYATPPVATIFSPAGGQTFYRNQPITFNGKGSNAVTFAFGCNSLTWTVDRIPGWTMQGCQGTPSFNLTGPVKITLTVRDDSNPPLTGSASVTVNLTDPPPSSPPIVTITNPIDYSLWSTTTYQVAGAASDPQGGPVTYRWTVTPSGGSEVQISTASVFNWMPLTVFTTSTTFELRLYGANNRGQTSVVKRTYFVQQPPR